MPLCVCALLPKVVTQTRIVLVVHYDELHKPSSTGRLLANVLTNCEVHLRGLRDGAAPLLLPEPSRARVLFPSDDAQPLVASATPLTLVVPEGTWGQAQRVMKRVPELREIARVRLPAGPKAVRALREPPRPDALPTAEAVASALAVLEGDQVAAELRRAHALWHAQVIEAREGRVPEL
jgi:DTW domain-containing protein YfiP